MEYSDTIPIQYQQGKTSFMGMDVLVDKRVLIPRPETELLVKVACDLLQGKKSAFVLDLATGSGIVALGITKLLPEARVVASDISSDALAVADINIKNHSLQERIELVRSDMFSFFGDDWCGKFDAIVSNPPYVSSRDYEKLDEWVLAEPRIALYAGQEGMDYLNILSQKSMKYLRVGGFLAVEVGYDQSRKVKDKFTECGFTNINSFKDFNKYQRVIVGQKNG